MKKRTVLLLVLSLSLIILLIGIVAKYNLSQFQTEGLYPYALKGDKVYVDTCVDCWGGEDYELIPNASIATFSVLNNGLARDINHVYYRGQIIAGADPSTFELIEGGHLLSGSVWRDESNIFIDAQILSNNPDSFESFLNSRDYKYFGLDQSVYLWKETIKGANRDTFRVINPPFTSDSKNVFCGERIIEGADPETFVAFETKQVSGESTAIYGKDSKYAYFCSPFEGRRIVRIEDVDVASFDATGMDLGHAKDKYREYYFHGVSNREEQTAHKVTIY